MQDTSVALHLTCLVLSVLWDTKFPSVPLDCILLLGFWASSLVVVSTIFATYCSLASGLLRSDARRFDMMSKTSLEPWLTIPPMDTDPVLHLAKSSGLLMRTKNRQSEMSDCWKIHFVNAWTVQYLNFFS